MALQAGEGGGGHAASMRMNAGLRDLIQIARGGAGTEGAKRVCIPAAGLCFFVISDGSIGLE